MNLEIYRFKETILAMINASPLPLEVKRMALNEVAGAVNEAANNAILEEKRAFEEQQKKEEEGNKEE